MNDIVYGFPKSDSLLTKVRKFLICESWLFIDQQGRYEETLEALEWLKAPENAKMLEEERYDLPKRIMTAKSFVLDPKRSGLYVFPDFISTRDFE